MKLVIEDHVREDLWNLWKDLVGDHLICQIELLTMVLIRWELRAELTFRRVLLFVDNNSARGGVLKGRSHRPTMDLVKALYSVDPAFGG